MLRIGDYEVTFLGSFFFVVAWLGLVYRGWFANTSFPLVITASLCAVFTVFLVIRTFPLWALVLWLLSSGMGTILNCLVVAVNHGMPVLNYKASMGALYLPMTNLTKLNFLGDWVFGKVSVGDMLILLGVLVFAIGSVITPNWSAILIRKVG